MAPDYAFCPLYLNEFHTEWSDGNAHAAGFTTAWPPNKAILGNVPENLGLDLDLNGLNEELGGPTFAAITSRSYHPNGVNVLMTDGSARFVKSSVDGFVWRRAGDGRGRRGARGRGVLIPLRRVGSAHHPGHRRRWAEPTLRDLR